MVGEVGQKSKNLLKMADFLPFFLMTGGANGGGEDAPMPMPPLVLSICNQNHTHIQDTLHGLQMIQMHLLTKCMLITIVYWFKPRL